MSKSTTLYLSMIAVLVIGLWTTLRIGRTLQAPHDISGTWLVADAGEAGPKSFNISQSGRFVKLKLDGGQPMNLVLASDTLSDTGRQMVFEGAGQTLAVHADDADRAGDKAKPYLFRFRGPIDAALTALRDEPSLPKHNTAAKH